ncbi:MAG: T9SS type A sorting domain-containing protein [Candidatus Fermentibacteraceae bacterium]|nr:T9SS type A sorting domain-containing protein [Candidatus Fermentibacteraceae bacterium]
MKNVLLVTMVLAAGAFAFHGNFDWQSFGGQPGDECSINLLESNADYMVMSVSVPGFWLGNSVANGTTWDSIELPGFYSQSDVGLPEVPGVAQMFALPFGTDAVVSIENVEYTTFPGINLVPVQTPEIDMPHNPFPFRQDGAVYNSNSFFPSQWAVAATPGTWGGISTDKLVATPFRYNPVTDELMVAKTMTVRIDFAGNPETLAYPSSETVRNGAAGMLINYSLVEADASVATDAEAAEFVFITTDANLSAITPLVEFYQGIGYETAVESFSGSATTSAIKAAITDHFDTSLTRFALIAGDHTSLPSYNYGNFVGDYWYACLVGTDLTPEIAVGRLTGNATQITNQVNKIIDGYYQFDFTDSNTTGIIPSTSVLAAHEQLYPGKYTQCCNEIAAYSYATNMSFWKIYPPEGGTAAMVSGWFNSGVGSVGYRGHGDVTYWAWSPGWNKTNIQALTNTFMPPVWNIACLCGQYQTGTECLAESWAWDDHGSSGALCANDPSYTEANHTYMKEIYKKLYDENFYNVGEAINEATIETIAAHGSIGETNAKMYIWFGDPAMEIFNNDVNNPTNLAISCNPGMVNPGSQTITMTVTSQGSPVSGATVALSDGIDGIETITFYETATTNGSGQVSFTVNVPSGATTLYTGARKHNYGPVSAKIDVYPNAIEDAAEGIETVVLGVAVAANPVTGSTALNFSTPVTGHAVVQVFDLSGRTVATLVNEEVGAGNHSVNWTPENISSGVYFVRLTTPAGTVSTQAMVLR